MLPTILNSLQRFGLLFATVAIVPFFFFHRKWLLALAGFLILLFSFTVRGADDQKVGSSEIPEVVLNVNGTHPPDLVAIKGGR
ncbi:MAG: hypothetical protein OXD43_08575, partial [Bacteroidetes bacterium]|nr:hypothetical protein [Bacteroidota bacterium]